MQNQSLPCFLKKYKTTTKTITQCHTLKNWCFWIVVLKKTLEGTLDSKEIKPVDPKGNQHWIFIERTDSESPILWPLGAKSWLIGKKNPDARKDQEQEKKGTTEGEMARWHQQTWVWANSRREWRTGKPGVLQSTGWLRHDWAAKHSIAQYSSVWYITFY